MYKIPKDMIPIVAFDYLLHNYDIHQLKKDPQAIKDFTPDQLDQLWDYILADDADPPDFLVERARTWGDLEGVFRRA